ncbi:hypothetical protein SAMN04487944_103223 [Gracilibacillus ureilyticus]|uniref:Uncharacterized protein n=1 Tax=Gracilibacillus ureilyticus TaxID=531814 RepID=A0A1H9NMX9_9BACI|nr:hypothetical protein SAMN04487944_103223 [Gracilibacillus ureilyticus]
MELFASFLKNYFICRSKCDKMRLLRQIKYVSRSNEWDQQLSTMEGGPAFDKQ